MSDSDIMGAQPPGSEPGEEQGAVEAEVQPHAEPPSAAAAETTPASAEPPSAPPAGPAGAPPAVTPKIARRRTALVVALVIGAAAIVAFAVLGYQAFTARLEAAEKLDRATAMVEDADAIVVRVDAVVRAKVTPDLAEGARQAEKEVEEAERLLAEAVGLIDDAFLDLNDDERERAELLKDSAEARQAMIARAPVILKANVQASTAMPLAEEGWNLVLEADATSDKAVAVYNKLTKAGVTESQKLNKQAAVSLATAAERFQAATDAFPAASFEQYIAYVQTRIKLNRLSQQSDTAWLKGDITKANEVIVAYNKEDAKAVEQAKQLPTSTAAAIADAFDKAVGEATDAYYAARDSALEADERLRTY